MPLHSPLPVWCLHDDFWTKWEFYLGKYGPLQEHVLCLGSLEFFKLICWHGNPDVVIPICIWPKEQRQNWYIENETKRPHFRRRHLKYIFFSGNVRILIQISLRFVPKGSIDKKSLLGQVIPCRPLAVKPWPAPQCWLSSMAYICVTQPQWVKKES